MLKVILTLCLLVSLTCTIDYDQANQKLRILNQKNTKISELEYELSRSQGLLKQCLARNKGSTGKTDDHCITEQVQKQRLTNKVRQLQNKVKDSLGLRDQDNSMINKLKNSVWELEDKVKAQVSKFTTLAKEKTHLETQIQNFKNKFDEFTTKVKDLEQEAVRKGRAHLDQVIKIKDEYEAKIKQSFSQKCDAVSSQFILKQQQCKKQVRTIGDKVRQLETAAVNKAKQFADKANTIKKQTVGRIKNFLTGKGPYNKQDQQDFAEFKNKVSSLEQKITNKINEIDTITKEKQDFDFQQRYCKAQLTDYDTQIRKLQQEAALKGKKYYVQQIKKLQKTKRPIPETTDDVIRSYQDRLTSTQQKLRRQLDENDRLVQQKRTLTQRIADLESGKIGCGQRDHNLDQEIARLKNENAEFRKLVRQIYDIKNK